ncbi:MAG: ABC transporter permease [Actinobacteria bacterium]|nr:ABC transporter permease [Actinomycetota bacterium]
MIYTPLILASIAQAIIIISGSLDLSLGASMSLFTVITAYFMTDTNVFPIVMLGFAVVFMTGALNGALIGKLGLSPLITTYATQAIIIGFAMFILPNAGGYVPKFFYRIYRADVLKVIPAPIFILIIGLIIWFVISRTTLYRYIYAIGSDEEAAYASGLKVSNIRFAAHLIASLFIAIAGLCILLSTATGDFRSGNPFALNSVAAVVVGGVSLTGGKGNIWGAVFGALILGLLNNLIFFAQISSFYQTFAKGMIIVLSLSMAAIPRIFEEKYKFGY